MNFEERLAQSQAKLEELKEKINKSIDSAKDAYQVDKKEAMIKLAKMNAAIEDFGKDVEAQVYCDVTSMKKEAEADAAAISNAMNEINDKIDAKIDADMKKYDEKAEKLQAKVDDSLATADGNLNAAIENNRLAKERYNSKLNATRLKVQMHQEEVKNRIESKKTELDKAAQEELIMDLLDYADDCQMVAYAYAMEAELAIMDACDEIADYEAKYGKLEDA
jgi:hypothetical protein